MNYIIVSKLSKFIYSFNGSSNDTARASMHAERIYGHIQYL
jgi:hypothetical protein